MAQRAASDFPPQKSKGGDGWQNKKALSFEAEPLFPVWNVPITGYGILGKSLLRTPAS